MARKLTKAELEDIRRADFNLPPVDPGQTELFGTQKDGKPKKKKPTTKAAAGTGRPRKHDETYSTTSFRLSPETLRRLRVRAALDGISPADLITRMVDEMHVPGIDPS